MDKDNEYSTDKQGNKYYVDAFTGARVEEKFGDPLRKEPNAEISRAMNYSSWPTYGSKSRLQIINDLRSVFIGEFKEFMRRKPEKRDKKLFIKACKRVNINPYQIMNVCV